MTKNADIDKYWVSGYRIGFDRHGNFSFPGTWLGKIATIFGIVMISSTKIDNRKKGYFNFWKRSNTGIRTYTRCWKNVFHYFYRKNKKSCLSLHYIKKNSYLFANGTEIIKLKSKDPEFLPYPLCLGNISWDWSVYNMKKTGLNWYVYDFSVDYDDIEVDFRQEK